MTMPITIPELYTVFKSCGAVTTDTRTLKGGELFFALKGENFDGNAYALAALNAGARYAVVDRTSEVARNASAGLPDAETASRIIPVDDTLKTLQELARWHRSMTFVNGRPLTVIALTGTNGKTTTKELIREVLSVRYNVTATRGNLNNSIGVPLTLLEIDSSTQIAVVEMGASHPGDIKELVDIALPDYGLITNVGKAHLLGFGSFEGVKRTKGELYDYLRRTSDKVFINADNPHLCAMANERQLHSDPERPYSLLIPYGVEYQGATVLPATAGFPYLRICLPESPTLISTHLIGAYNADNVMAAIAVGMHFGVSLEDAVKAVSDYVPSNSRSQMTRTSRNVMIVDAYNANPTSMEAALTNFSRIEAPHKALMLGDMLELGEDSLAEHERTVSMAMSSGAEKVFVVGREFGKAVERMEAEGPVWFETSQELADFISAHPLDGFTVLIKGSRGTRMEKVIPEL